MGNKDERGIIVSRYGHGAARERDDLLARPVEQGHVERGMVRNFRRQEAATTAGGTLLAQYYDMRGRLNQLGINLEAQTFEQAAAIIEGLGPSVRTDYWTPTDDPMERLKRSRADFAEQLYAGTKGDILANLARFEAMCAKIMSEDIRANIPPEQVERAKVEYQRARGLLDLFRPKFVLNDGRG